MLPDAEVLEELTGAGGSIADYFFIGESFFCINSRGMIMGVAADDELCEAMAAYLRRVSVPVYSSDDEAYRHQMERRTKSCT